MQPLFISIDPERDRRQGLTEYVAAFHPAILGLSGDDAATKDAANSFKIYFGRALLQNSALKRDVPLPHQP